MSADLFYYEGDSKIIISKWKIKVASYKGFAINQIPFVLFTYRQLTSDGQWEENEQKYKINKSGIIVKRLLKINGDFVEPNESLFEYELCSHQTLMKDLCAVCGANITNFDTVEQRKITANTSIAMVHSIPELRVSKQIAEELGTLDEQRLLNSRKLVLLVDLDQTIVHTTNQQIPNDIENIHHYKLYGSDSPWYHTKFRPYMNEFLEAISHYYELHICTFGARRYAHQIANLIDSKSRFFPKDRILSRDEFFDPCSKTGNMRSLFPCGDSMVCVIDDRVDVWNNAPNVVQVKPYNCFKTDDINAPEKLNLPFSNDTLKNNEAKIEESTENTSTSTSLNDLTDNELKIKKIQQEKDQSADLSYENLVNDKDDYLLYLKDILIRIHRKYYEEYDDKKKYSCEGETIKIPDLKEIIPQVQKRTLHGVNIVFSGVIATNSPPHSNRFYRLAESLGAVITNEIIVNGSPKTTHLIAAKWGTAKVNRSSQYKHIKMVTPEWLIACSDRWEKVEEDLFALTKQTVYNISDDNHNRAPVANTPNA